MGSLRARAWCLCSWVAPDLRMPRIEAASQIVAGELTGWREQVSLSEVFRVARRRHHLQHTAIEFASKVLAHIKCLQSRFAKVDSPANPSTYPLFLLI